VINSVTPGGGLAATPVTFGADISGSVPMTYAWDFGGGATPNTSSLAAPQVTLGAAGTYNGQLTVNNSFGSDVFDFQIRVIASYVTELLLVYNSRDGWLGRPLDAAGLQVIFATPGMVMATVFVALPLVIRELVPVLEEVGDEQEQAARSLGANGAQTFWRVTLPSIKWAVVYGVVLSLARSLGEFGAVKIVSGNVVEKTQTTTLVVEQTYQNFEQGTAYAAAFLLAFASVLCIVIVSILRPKDPA
jgi:ABC-type sulfate transport system permease subunit